MSLLIKYLLIFNLGLFTSVSQIILTREFISTFSGNELSIGILLFSWFLGAGIGNLVAEKYAEKLKFNIVKIYFFNLIYCLLIILIVRFLRVALNYTPGEIISITTFLLFSIIFILPYNLIFGLTFPVLYKLLQSDKSVYFSESKLYYIEAFGALTGYILATFVIIKLFSPFVIISALLFLIAILIILNNFKKNIALLIFSILIGLSLIYFDKTLNFSTEKWRIGNFKIKKIIESPYGKIVITQIGNNISIYNNGVLILSTSDDVTPQIDASILLAESKNIKNILLFGANYKILNELVNNPLIENIVVIEIDPIIIKIQKRLSKTNLFANSKVNAIISDPRYFIQNCKIKFDAILSTMPDPVNLNLNRYYTTEFFNRIKKILKPEGIFCFKITSSENFINRPQGMYIGSIYNTLKNSFNNIIIIPGDSNYFIAAKKENTLKTNITEIYQRYISNNGSSQYFLKYFLNFNFDNFRRLSLLNSIDFNTRINRDLNPITYFYDITLWSTRFSQGLKNIFLSLYRLDFKIVIFLILIIFAILYAIIKDHYNAILLSMGVIGFTEISLELFIILAYQNIKGYLYTNVGLIYASFMLGLAVGSYFYQKMKTQTKYLFKIIQALFIFIPLMIYFLYFLIDFIKIEFLQDFIFMLATLGFSILSGIQFPTAVNLFSEKSPSVGKINSVDLISSSTGAFLSTLLVIPIFGLFELLIILSVINLLAFIILVKKL